MKVSDVAKKYHFNEGEFEKWLQGTDVQVKVGMFGGGSIDDNIDTDKLAAKFKSEKNAAEQAALEQKKLAEKAENEKKQAMAGMLITSGFNFDGYTIAKYSGYISGDSAVSMDRPRQGWGGGVNRDAGEDLLAGLSNIRRKALEELKEAAYALGCNAVIGVDFDYITLDPETATTGGGTLYLPFLFAVTANGNAVVIEKK
jgi:uncharacterized protein YbjQ (UPF0145 family)